MYSKFKYMILAIAAAVAGCGGGGGSSGETQEHYTITVRADKNQLPVNIANVEVGIGVYRPYTTTLYVEARKGSLPIPGGEDIFSCNVAGGLSSGVLYYLDGDEEHETEVDDGNGGKITVPNAYRNITLGSNAGGNSFHFHAGDQAGTARITCTVTDPLDKQQKTASVNITVGGTTDKPASVRMVAQVTGAGGYLGTRNNANGLLNQTAIQAFVLDDMNQPTSNSTGGNVQVRILSGTDAGLGARLVSGSQTGSVLQLPAIGGIATFSLLSGTETGPVFLELTADRADNNVSNGVADPITSILPITVLEAITAPIALADVTLATATKGIAYTAYLEVTGGLPPYSWSATGLPPGLFIDSSTGVISGKVSADAAEREYQAKVTVVDKNKLGVTATVKITVVGGIPEDFAIGDCNTNDLCLLGSAPVGSNFTYSFVSSTTGVTWAFAGLPAWLTSATAGSGGVINGSPAVANCGPNSFLVTATKGVTSVTRRFSVTVVDGALPAQNCP